MKFTFEGNPLNKEQLLNLNQAVQALEIEQRLAYLQSIDGLYDYLEQSELFLIDERDYNVYSVVRIGEDYWLGENLRYKACKHYEHPANPNLNFGCLYDWTTIMQVEEKYKSESFGENPQNHPGIAPKGWRIPSDQDWKNLERTLGMKESYLDSDYWRGMRVGNKLKVSEHWEHASYIKGGNNESGFAALPTGIYNTKQEHFDSLGLFAIFATSSEDKEQGTWIRVLHAEEGGIMRSTNFKEATFSCRCIKK